MAKILDCEAYILGIYGSMEVPDSICTMSLQLISNEGSTLLDQTITQNVDKVRVTIDTQDQDYVVEWADRSEKRMSKGRYILVAGSWISLFVTCWLIILGIVELWPAAIFIILFLVIGSLSPLYGKGIDTRNNRSGD